jgi:UTP--glucose-1-phosphate uridylyltransferase
MTIRHTQRIRKAIVPAAGFGTRMLPAAKAVPKPLLPLGSKPVIQHVVEELARAGVEHVLFIINRRTEPVRSHFMDDPELNEVLERGNKTDLLKLARLDNMGVRFDFALQEPARGLADAILHGEEFVGNEPFFVSLGDCVIRGGSPGASLLDRMSALHAGRSADAVIALERVPEEKVDRYGIVIPDGQIEDGNVKLRGMVEKPTRGSAPSNLAICARYIYHPDIFDAIRQTVPAANGEIMLPDATRLLMKRGATVHGVVLEEGQCRYDIGSFGGYYRAFVDFALDDPNYGADFRRYFKDTLSGK